MTPLNFEIRWLIRSDMDAVLAIERESFPHPWTAAEFVRCLRQRNMIGRGVVVGVRVVAYAIYELRRDEIKIENFAVAREFRRRGAGRFLVGTLAEKCGPQRRRRIVCNVCETNLVGHLFLRACGWRCVKVERDAYEDCDQAAYVFELRHRDVAQRRLLS